MNIISDNALRNKSETSFKILFFVYLMLGTCNLTYGTPIVSVMMYVTFSFGGVIILWRLLYIKKFIKSYGLIWVLLLLVSYAFSTVTNMQYFNKQSIVVFVLWCFYFLILFLNDPERKRETSEKELHLIFGMYLAYVTLLVVISCGMFITGYGMSYRDLNNNNYEVVSGFFFGRLWGAFQDPNLGSVMCCISVVISGYFMWFFKKKIVTVLLSLDIAVMVFYIALSDSRNGMVTAGCVLGFTLFFYLFRKYHDEHGKKAVLKKTVSMLAVAVVAFAGAALPKVVQKGYNAFIVSQEGNKNTEDPTDTDTKLNQFVVNRGYDIKENVSNNRFAIWETGINIALDKPLTGVSFNGLLPYAKANYPDSYMVSNGLWEFNTLDNDYLNVFVSQGLPGILIVLILAVTCVVKIFKNIWTVDKKYFPAVLVCTVTVCSLVISAIFQGTMFYQQTPNTALFWLLLGSLCLMLSADDGCKVQLKEEI